MSDLTNLVYNADFSKGTSGWSWSGMTVSGNTATGTGDMWNSYFIPCSGSCKYEISFDIKFETTVSSNFYIALVPYDEYKNNISIIYTNRASSCDTTLASNLTNGATTATLTNASNFPTSHTYQRLGICNNIAYGYKRAAISVPYSSKSGNVINLKSAWSGGTISAGTRVSCFYDGATYFYPISFGVSSSMQGKWYHYSAVFYGGDSVRATTQYINFSTLGYSNKYSIKNLSIKNMSTLQICEYKNNYNHQFFKNGVVSSLINEVGKPVRYIRDSINGSSANAYNHWVEIQAYDHVGNNVCFNKNAKLGTGSYGKLLVTDGSSTTSQYIEGASNVTVDIGFVTNIERIKVWHYWGDGRTYNDHKVEISIDGSTWETVYIGKKQETSSGIEINLCDRSSTYELLNTGVLLTKEIIEL